ncbi:MAG: cation:proton antiporter [Balneolaceae bacterium]|nr:cation:proton antiporter [Balneolaceae bacterium]MBO6545322.1 cation:proton antiporter [Balneolaceae bacterium]MBO6646718.1 cation:proton antiporter [Balneolaceae bacterium]
MMVLWLVLAYLLGMGVKQLKLPPLIGYLIAGVVLSLFGVSDDTHFLHEVGHYGVVFLLFTVGLHLRIKNIVRPEVFGAGSIHLIISTGIFLLISMAFGFDLIEGLIIGTLLGFSSTVLAAKTLESRGELNAFHARVSIGILILQDIVAITVLALTGGGAPQIWSIGLLALPLLRPLIIKLLSQSGHEDLQLLFGLILALGGAGLFEFLGLSSELGALVAGALLSGNKLADELAEKLWGLKEAFLVAFFLEVGLAGLPSMGDLAFAGAILAILPVKAALFFFLLVLFKLRSRNSFMVTVTLSSFSEFTLIAGMVAASAGFIPQSVIIVFAVVTAVSYTINAPLSSKANVLWKKLENVLIPLERDVKHPGQQVVNLGGAEYLIVGMGQSGSAAYDYLKEREFRVTGMDSDPAKIESNIQKRRRTVYGDAQDAELWENIDLSGVKSIMLAMPNPDTKVSATQLLRENKYSGDIYALTMRDEEHQALKEAGANAVCLPLIQAGRKLAEISISDQIDGSMSLDVDMHKVVENVN